MNVPYILVVIDMQPQFDAANDQKTIDNVVTLCHKAIADGAAIFIVEFTPVIYGRTQSPILDVVQNYERMYRVIKSKDDGGYEIAQCCILHHIDANQTKFLFCGVNYQFCVRSSVAGLVRECNNADQIEVVKAACNGPKYRGYWSQSKTSTFLKQQGVQVNRRRKLSV